MLFLFTWEVTVYWRASKKIGPQKLLRLQDVATFRSDHPRNKSGIQLRSQIVWTFHFWSPFNDPRHPLAVRLQCLKILSGKKKQHIKSGLKNNKTIYKISARVLHIFCIYTENNVYRVIYKISGLQKSVYEIVNNFEKGDPCFGLTVSHWLKGNCLVVSLVAYVNTAKC